MLDSHSPTDTQSRNRILTIFKSRRNRCLTTIGFLARRTILSRSTTTNVVVGTRSRKIFSNFKVKSKLPRQPLTIGPKAASFKQSPMVARGGVISVKPHLRVHYTTGSAKDAVLGVDYESILYLSYHVRMQVSHAELEVLTPTPHSRTPTRATRPIEFRRSRAPLISCSTSNVAASIPLINWVTRSIARSCMRSLFI